MDKITKENIKKLKKEKNYDKIFLIYGTKIYIKNTPSKIQKKEIKKLLAEGKYLDIYNKFGEVAYNKYLVKAMFNEIKENRGTIKASLWKLKTKFKKALAVTTGTLMLAPATFATLGAIVTRDNYIENGITYADEIEDYNENIKKYAKEVQKMKLTDVQVFMKVMDDMWENIQGYGKPEKDISGYYELDLATEEGYGVCRNMASDVAKKLNAINSDYNARTIIVEMGEEGTYTRANIKSKYVKQKEDNNDENQNHEETTIDKIEKYVFGNHLVTLVDIQEDNLILVLDPTNAGIGLYEEGKITMLNSGKENGLEFEPKEYVSSWMLGKGGMENIVNVIGDYGKSFKKPKLSLDEIEKKYGLEAQNSALKYTREYKNFRQEIKIENNEKQQNKNQNQKEEQKIYEGEER